MTEANDWRDWIRYLAGRRELLQKRRRIPFGPLLKADRLVLLVTEETHERFLIRLAQVRAPNGEDSPQLQATLQGTWKECVCSIREAKRIMKEEPELHWMTEGIHGTQVDHDPATKKATRYVVASSMIEPLPPLPNERWFTQAELLEMLEVVPGVFSEELVKAIILAELSPSALMRSQAAD